MAWVCEDGDVRVKLAEGWNVYCSGESDPRASRSQRWMEASAPPDIKVPAPLLSMARLLTPAWCAIDPACAVCSGLWNASDGTRAACLLRANATPG